MRLLLLTVVASVLTRIKAVWKLICRWEPLTCRKLLDEAELTLLALEHAELLSIYNSAGDRTNFCSVLLRIWLANTVFVHAKQSLLAV